MSRLPSLHRPGALALAALLATPLAAQAPRPVGGALRSGIDTSAFDRSVRPQDDFYRYVNGGWLARNEIPGDATSWGAFAALSEESRRVVHELMQEAARANAPAGSDKRKVGDLYASMMDSAAIEARGLAPLAPYFARIAQVQATRDLPAAFAWAGQRGIGTPFGAGVGPDQKDSRRNIVSMGQSGLGLPDRDYYFRPEPQMASVREAYRTYVTMLFTLAKQPDPAGAAQRVIALETELATRHWDRVRSRDRDASYNRMAVDSLAKLLPRYDIRAHLREAGLGAAREVVVRQPDYLVRVDSVIAATPVATWREYLTYKLLDGRADRLPAAFADASFEFRSRTLSGQQQRTERWKRAVGTVNAVLGEAVGRLYVERMYTPEAKRRMDAMVANLRRAYSIGIDSLEWMSPATKAQAQEKLRKFTVKIGHPEQWRDYSALRIERGDLFGNLERATEWSYRDAIGRLDKPVDRARWGMTPQTVNAYYSPVLNEIAFPAAILQPPFFDVTADDAVNYGAIGAVIGHEIGHGFDDQGRKSDGDGNLRDWWTTDDAKAFEARAARLGAQYEAIEPLPGLRINGKLTMGENIGDLSGLAQAYRAWRLSLNGAEPPVIDGLTGDQRFFMGYAQVWRGKMRDQAMRQRLLTDPHSPGEARARVPVMNNDVFHRVFGTKPGDGMWLAPEQRVRIW